MQWQAKWIWAESQTETKHCYIYARREIDLPSLGNAVAHITCSSGYKLYVNGRYIGRGPGPCDPSSQVCDSHDIKRCIREGKNVIGVICHNPCIQTSVRPKTPGGFLMQLESQNGDGSKVLLVSDESWSVKTAEEWAFSSVDENECFDSRKKPVGWHVIGFDDSTWQPAEVIGEVGVSPWTDLPARTIALLEEREAFPVGIVAENGFKRSENMLAAYGESAIASPGTASVELDFGQQIVGYPKIRFRDGGAAAVEVSYGSAPDIFGKPDTAFLHGGRQEWQTFGRRTFRYMQVKLTDMERLSLIDCVSCDAVGYPVRQVWYFECSDEVLTGIYRNGMQQLSQCMQNTYEADPQRHPVPWPSMARIQALANYYSFGDTELAAKTIRDIVHPQEPNGFFNALWPACRLYTSPSQALFWIMMLHDYYLYTGDKILVEEMYPAMRLLMEGWLRSREDEQGLLVNSAGEQVAAWNALYYKALRDASKLAIAMGNIDDCALWHSRAEAIFDQFNSHFWSRELSSYTSQSSDARPSFVANILAIALGLVDVERASLARESVLCKIRESASFSSVLSFYILQALSKLDLVSDAQELIRSKWALSQSNPCWVYIYFLAAEVLGVKPSTAQSPAPLIEPSVGPLAWAKGGFAGSPGFLDVEWQYAEAKFALTVNAPDGFSAGLPVTLFNDPVVREVDLSPDTPVRRARRTHGWKDIIWQGGEEHDPYLDWLKTQGENPPSNYEPKVHCSQGTSRLWVQEPAASHIRLELYESPQGQRCIR